MGTIHIVVGGQFGSEGKGHFAAQLAQRVEAEIGTPMLVRTGGPNAGHSAVDNAGRTWRLRQIPAAAVVNFDAPICIAEGSEIDCEVLESEIMALENADIPIRSRLFIDSQATIIEGFHIKQETQTDLTGKIGSTGKGVGAARAARMMREAAIWGPVWGPGLDNQATVTRLEMGTWLDERQGDIIIEATQGYGLGLHAGFYPKCTSRNVRAIDVLAECGISPWQPGVDCVITWVVFRPFPIRVAGDSGPLSNETTWEDLGFQPEFTTVTKKMRRVGYWNAELARDAMIANGHPGDGRYRTQVQPIMMFADYLDPSVYEATELDQFTDSTWAVMDGYEDGIGAPLSGYGTSPSTFVWRNQYGPLE